ncbi:MFS transporter [Streptomyces sp. NPDC091287]|uniref:MFS transporter n=1 Tax=Streptomyces sp. NPDC091287 TaxID=3365988 RepID=UPI00381AD6B7
MTVDIEARPPRSGRNARTAVAVLFFTNGAVFANLLPRYPQIKDDLAIGNGAYGLAVAAFPAGAIAAGLAAGVLIRRVGSAQVAAVGTLLTAMGILAAGLAPSPALFAGALFLAGAMDALTDVAQNAHGLRVQRLYGRSILNSFHAIWSIGAVTGGLMAAGAMSLGLSLGVHLTISAIVLALAAMTAWRFCLPGPDNEPEEAGPERRSAEGAVSASRVGYVLAALVLIATAGTLVEDAGNSWAALYLTDSLHTSAALAAWGFIALVGAQFIGRIIGDRLVDRFGQRAVARTGGLITAVGMGFALAVPTLPGTILGFALAGFGVATLVPAAMHEADALPGLKPGSGLTIVSWLMRLGFLLSPPVVGYVADATSLRTGLLVIPCAGLLVVVLAKVLRGRRE